MLLHMATRYRGGVDRGPSRVVRSRLVPADQMPDLRRGGTGTQRFGLAGLVIRAGEPFPFVGSHDELGGLDHVGGERGVGLDALAGTRRRSRWARARARPASAHRPARRRRPPRSIGRRALRVDGPAPAPAPDDRRDQRRQQHHPGPDAARRTPPRRPDRLHRAADRVLHGLGDALERRSGPPRRTPVPP